MAGIKLTVLGDSGPFSQLGISVSYHVEVGKSQYLVDCGAPLFRALGVDGLRKIKALVCTHSHEDHRRWFTDIALFNSYVLGQKAKLKLIAAEKIHEEYEKNSKGALERSLSSDSKKVIEIPYSYFVDKAIMGPKAKYTIGSLPEGGNDAKAVRVVDNNGRMVPPERAKIVINPSANRPRMLFLDPDINQWVEPESFYSFSSPVFYEDDKNVYHDNDEDITIQPVKETAWHGPFTTGVKISTKDANLIFSSDTVYNPALWKELCEEYHQQNLRMTRKEFLNAATIIGDINDYIERTWSRERYEAAVRAYDNAVLIHDVGAYRSVVHTDYELLENPSFNLALLTHSPDRFVSKIPLAIAGKKYRIIDNTCYEEVDGQLYRLNASVYYKDIDKSYVGFESEDGEFKLVRKDHLLHIMPRDMESDGRLEIYLHLLMDINGHYFPYINDPAERYWLRDDGKIEHVKFISSGSKGKVVKDLRERYSGRAVSIR